MIVDGVTNNIVLGVTGVAEEIMQNVKTIITTRKGTVPLDRDFGISFDFLDAPTPQARGQMETDIFLQIEKYEPRAVLQQIIFEFDPLAGGMMPKVKIGMRGAV